MKYCGQIGYAATIEDPNRPGIYKESIVYKPYKGDVQKSVKRWDGNSESINDNININNTISVIADPYALENLGNIRCATFCGSKWKVNNIDLQLPRLILSLGGVWNGE